MRRLFEENMTRAMRLNNRKQRTWVVHAGVQKCLNSVFIIVNSMDDEVWS